MTPLSNTVLNELNKMDDYDRMLSLDRIARENNLSTEQVKEQLRVYQQGGVSNSMANPIQNDVTPVSQPSNSPAPSSQPNYLQDAHRYRVRYDPSHDGQSRQANVEQAILCPHCGAPLGIPAIRPIKVTCPNCMNEAMFEN